MKSDELDDHYVGIILEAYSQKTVLFTYSALAILRFVIVLFVYRIKQLF